MQTPLKKKPIPFPTKIISKPYRLGTNKPLMIPYDNGITYRLADLAKLIGYSLWGFSEKLKLHGWKHPNILKPPTPHGFTVSGKANRNALKEKPGGNDAWKALSNESRKQSLIHG